MDMPIKGHMYINGAWVSGNNRDITPVTNPATGTICGTVPTATIADVDMALHSAHKAFKDYAMWSPHARAKLLHKIAHTIRSRANDIGTVMTMEQGKPINEATGEIQKLADAFDFYAEESTRIHGHIIANSDTSIHSFVDREPIGVVGAITPWNYPAELIGWKLAATLAAGCAIVIKPPELTPLSPFKIMQCIDDADTPAGLVNMVMGKGSVIGQHLVESPLVDKIAFTGSSETGLRIQQSLQQVKPISLELGGNCPMVVTVTANLTDAVTGAVRRAFRNCGQICIAINRIYVHRCVYDDFIHRLATATDILVVDNGIDNPNADMGAICSPEVLTKTQIHLQDALKKGAKLVAGGHPPQGEKFKQGMFFCPTVIKDCDHSMLVMTTETFGPLVGVMPYDDIHGCIELMNDTPYGLASYVYSTDMGEIKSFSRGLQYGNVAINNVDAGIMNAPYGGWKQSGIGVEHAREGMLEYLKYKHIRLKI